MNWRRSMIGLGVALPLVLLLGFGLTRDPGEIKSPLPGQAAPGFALPLLDPDEARDSVRLAQLRGQVVVINFWASWCLACRDEHADLSETAVYYQDRGVRFFGVLYKDSRENARRWIQAMGGQSYPSLVDERTTVAIDYGLYGVPETFIIDQSGKVVYKHVGPVTSAVLRAIIDPLLIGEQPAG
jgi:cytochrome c biogenesis protein CcmG/thiol:disulfide interchange protein DsbE